jgi:hypothetical protein
MNGKWGCNDLHNTVKIPLHSSLNDGPHVTSLAVSKDIYLHENRWL